MNFDDANIFYSILFANENLESISENPNINNNIRNSFGRYIMTAKNIFHM